MNNKDEHVKMDQLTEITRQIERLIEGHRWSYDSDLDRDLTKIATEDPIGEFEWNLGKRLQMAIERYNSLVWFQSKRVLKAMHIGLQYELKFNLKDELNNYFKIEFDQLIDTFHRYLKFNKTPKKKYKIYQMPIERYNALSLRKINSEIDIYILKLNKIFWLKNTPSVSKKILRFFPKINNLHWNDVKIIFNSKDSIKIIAKDKKEVFTFSEIGFVDERKGDLPTVLWELLYYFAQHNGTIDWSSKISPRLHRTMITNISRLRKQLKSIMQIKDDPFHLYRERKTYKTKFEILDESYR